MSDKDDAPTALETVMAEQVSHNVVNDTQSASASAPADVAANQTNATPAHDGTTASDDTPISKDNSITAASTVPPTTNGPKADDVTTNAAEPSAGEAVPMVSQGEGITDDGSAADTSADHSVHSDTDGSRADIAEQKLEGNHHIRTNSVKKPTTFSKVSVTKQFMAKSATPVSQVAKAGEKPSAVTAAPQLTAKPRLVAKTGSSLQTIQKARSSADSLGGPDASRVWNKNRPAPVAPPKQFTDEELKQQYGIHLATRLQTDEDGKESKWADIDDDEDDWAPETVVWMDGTKSTLTPAEIAPADEEQKITQQPVAKPAPTTRPILALKKAGESGTPKTILKPGAVTLQAKQNGAASTSSSGEKPSLKAKSPAPGSSKSPWAALPPIEAVSPLNPPVQAPPQAAPTTALPTQDARAYESQPPPQPAREIAADTFDRSWREGEGGTRELFNSANGRYEPAPGGRRTSIKPESTHRKPSVLQRPSQSGAVPAEPSAAFQSRTSSQVDGAAWSRRRGSNVSQGSIPPARRMSTSKPQETQLQPMSERRPSMTVSHDSRGSPLSARNDTAKPSFAPQTTWDQQMPPRPEPGIEAEDPVKVQERVMREKRELAVKRRKEEEERQETEKQERLKAKLAALEGAGKSKKEREAEAAAAIVTAPIVPAAEPRAGDNTVELNSTTPQPTSTESNIATAQPAEISASLAADIEAQTVTPALKSAIESAATADAVPLPQPSKQHQPHSLSDPATPAADSALRSTSGAHLSPGATARTPFAQQQSSPYRSTTSSYSSPKERKSQPFGRSPLTSGDSFTPWPSSNKTGNVWGTAGIGNGVFEKPTRFAPMQASSLPPPPGIQGLGRPPTSNRISPQGFGQEPHSPNMYQSSLADQSRAFPPPGIESRPEAAWNQTRSNDLSPAPGLTRQPHAPGPIAPPSRAYQQQQQQGNSRSDPLLSWKNAALTLQQQYATEAQEAERERERNRQSTAAAAPRQDVIKETFKQTSAGSRLGGPRKLAKTEFTVHDAQGSRAVGEHSPAPPNTQTQPIGPVPTASPLTGSQSGLSENTVRIPDGSLNPAHGGLPKRQPPIAPPHVRKQAALTAYQGNVKFPASPLAPVVGSKEDQSPPPPETSSHPVNIGSDVKHPHVKLPQAPPPRPVVKLPPPPMSTQQPLNMMPPRPVQTFAPNGGAVPIAQRSDWQARFNYLLHVGSATIQTEVPPSPPKTPPKVHQDPAPAVTSSSRALLEDVPGTISATVSLPQSPKHNFTHEGFVIDNSDNVVSKPTVDEMFIEDRTFGSTPRVAFPRNPKYDDEVYRPRTQHNMLKMPPNSRFNKSIDSQNMPEWVASTLIHKHPNGMVIKLPGMKSNRIARYVNNSRKGSAMQSQERKSSGKHNKGKPHRDTDFSPTASTPSGPSRKTSLQQKAPTPAPASPGTDGSTANVEGGSSKKRDSKWAKPPRGGPRGRNEAPIASS